MYITLYKYVSCDETIQILYWQLRMNFFLTLISQIHLCLTNNLWDTKPTDRAMDAYHIFVKNFIYSLS